MRALLLLSLCAGCGDDEPSDADADADTDVDTDADTDSDTNPTVYECPGFEGGAGIADETEANVALEEDLFAAVNAARASGATCGGSAMPAVPALEMNHAIRCASRMHARDMAANGVVGATDDLDYDARFRLFGYYGTRFGGTAASDKPTAADAMEEWMRLSGSCELMLRDTYQDFGVGTASGFWSIGFGSTRP